MAGFYTCFITRQDRGSRSCIVLWSQARRLVSDVGHDSDSSTSMPQCLRGSFWLPLDCSSEAVIMLILASHCGHEAVTVTTANRRAPIVIFGLPFYIASRWTMTIGNVCFTPIAITATPEFLRVLFFV